MSKKYVPFCTGDYDAGDDICDGDPNGATDHERNPCIWRDRCAAFALYVQERNESVEEYIEMVPDPENNAADAALGRPIKGRANFIELCDKQIKRFGVVEGKATEEPEPEEPEAKEKSKRRKWKKQKHGRPPTKRMRKQSARALRKKAIKKRKELLALFEHFKMHFIEHLEGYKFTPPKGVVRPGRFYVIDRSRTSKYISIYFKQAGVLGIPVALVNFKPRTTTFDIELPVEYTGYSGIDKGTMKKIHPEPIEDGRFKSVCKEMDMEGVALVAQTIARLIILGKIELPSDG